MSYFRDNIEQMSGYVPGFQPENQDVVKLNTNENPYQPSSMVCKAIAQIEPENLRRYPDPTGRAFREVAAQVNGVAPENIVCCNGGDDLLKTAIISFCDKDRPLAYPVPTYTLYPVLAKMQGCAVIEVPFDNEFNLPAKLISAGAPLTILCNPNAPSGSFINIDEIASLANELKGVLLVDEAYADFAEDNCARLVEKFDNLIILRSMSKGYSLAGMRFGYGIAQASLIDGLSKVLDSYPVDVVSIAAATAAIKDQGYFKTNVEKIKKERARVTKALQDLNFAVQSSSSNFILAGCKNCQADDIYGKLADKDIYVRYFNAAGLKDKLRITIGTKEQNDKLLAELQKILAKQG